MGSLTVAAVQLGLYRKDGKAVEEAERQTRQASGKGARLVCLPEHWLPLTRILSDDDPILRKFSSLANELGVYINMGANFERRGSRTFMTSHTLSPKGDIIGRQDKVHLYLREKRTAIPGSGFNPMTIDGFKVGVLVCHDVVFPETAREAVFNGAELLLVPSLITATGIEPWLVYARARALENRVPVVASNDYFLPTIPGRSTILDLKYDGKRHIMELVERTVPAGKNSLLAELDLSSNRRHRDERLRELHPDLRRRR